jgi:hypothetical protein
MIVVRCETVAGYTRVDGSDTIHIRGRRYGAPFSIIMKGYGMPDKGLTSVQRSVLMILMAEAREVPNATLTNQYRLKLDKKYRDDLEGRGQIKVRRSGQPVFLELTEPGWLWCSEQDWAEVPAGSGHGSSAAYAILAGLLRNLHRLGKSTIPELFTRSDQPVADDAVQPTDVEAQVRKAYQELAVRPGAPVKLADLRAVLGGVARSEMDRVLVQMNRLADVSIVPESDQKVLTDRDLAAAVQIGNQDKHLITVGP